MMASDSPSHPSIFSHSLVQQSCTNDSECVPTEFPTANVPSELVSCVDGACLCLQCFTPNTTSGLCALHRPCFDYDYLRDECVDNRKSRETALLLSIFLSSSGAANFYIGQNVLGGVQLGLLTILILSICLCTCCGCCLICFDDDFEGCCCDCYDGESMFICLFLFLLFLVCLVLLVIMFWWAVDIAVFSLNDRPDGNGCSLVV